ncbi:hypothetical protein CXIVA_24830 [Clostridium sp. SY8519]|uniref:radical SAM/SPASM domain-containing protein n=1 Tax=Clostridium sp. (strain SY8519) TaxID=1042156 RepID=UPI0002172296|nr:radical SAM protein [Clostridium sp. SY8519]BAK48450.1 hypothetical protein CXIVA_24830 [Clostridium sp. SY8519]
MDRKGFFNSIKKMDLSDGEAISRMIEKKGIYKESDTFPLASLQFELTSRCNAFCRHCYNNSGAENIVKDEMTSKEWIRFSNYLVEHGGIFECIISGGEPLLIGNDIFKIMDILHDDGTIFTFLTNGFLLDTEKIHKLEKYKYHWLQISIDGLREEYHDWFRNCKGSWKKAVEAAKKVSESNIPLKIAHCVTPTNINEIGAMCDFAFSIGAKEIIAGELSLSGRTFLNRELLLTDIQRKEMISIIHEKQEQYNGKMRIKSSNSVKKGLERHREIPYSNAVIRSNGDIRLDGMAPFVVGNILKDDFAAVWKNRIKDSWEDKRVSEFIDSFEIDDRNYKFVNYIDVDIYI